MPLANGCSLQIIQQNIAELVASGYPRSQAVAIALDHARKQDCDLSAIIPNVTSQRPNDD